MIRAIAVLAVVVSHSAVFLQRLYSNPKAGSIVHQLVDLTTPLGSLGVELFFVLSGFLIGGILIRTFEQEPQFTFVTVRTFWLRRWMRTLPLYWLILTANILLYKAMGLSNFQTFQPLYYLFVQNLWYPHPGAFFGEAWSLSVEEWFYLTLPIALLLFLRLKAIKDKRKFLLRIFIGYLLVFAVARLINAIDPLYPDQDSGIRKIVLFRLDAVMYGVLFAWLHYFRPSLFYKYRHHLLALSVAGIGGIYYFMYASPAAVFAPGQPAARFVSNAFLYLYLPLLFSLCLPFARSIGHIGNRYLSATITHISKISYALYLVHYSLIFMPFFYTLQLTSTAAVIGYYLLYWAISIALSSLLHHYYEQPIMRLRDKFSAKGR